MGFWIAAIAVAALAAFHIARPLALTRRRALSRAAHDEQVFRDQLAEIDNDLERGVLTAEEARAARIEVSRRLLAAAAERERAEDHAPAPKAVSFALAAALVVGAPLGGWALYEAIGAPGLPDQPLSARMRGARPAQAVAEARRPEPAAPPPEAAELVAAIEELETRLESDGPDRQTLFALAQARSQLGRFDLAWRAYEDLIGLAEEEAPAALHVAKAETMILAVNGYVSPEAEAALRRALEKAPEDPVARYYLGAAYAQTGRPETAVETWTDLLADSPVDAPWREAAIAQIRDTVERAGLPAPDLPAPREPTEAERRDAMEQLVTRLDDRLAAEGGTPEQWARLVRSWRALDRPEEAAAAETRARDALGAEDAALAAFETALAREAPPPAAQGGDPSEAIDALEARLSGGGGDPATWLRLITAYLAADDGDGARAALARAREDLADQPARLAALESALSEGRHGRAGAGAEAALGMPGPSAEDVEAAAEMPAEDRMAMIRGMVEGLRDRLYDDGGSPEEWARLVRTLTVLGDADAAREARDRGLAAHAGDAAAEQVIARAAREAGVGVE